MEHILFNIKTGKFLAEPVPFRWVAAAAAAVTFSTKDAAKRVELPPGVLAIPVRKGLA